MRGVQLFGSCSNNEPGLRGGRGWQGSITAAECCWHLHCWQEAAERLHRPRDGRGKPTIPEPGSRAGFRLALHILGAQRVSALALQVAKGKKPAGLNASFPTFLPMRVLWIHWPGPALEELLLVPLFGMQ